MLADELDYVLGVDTHRDEHAMAVVASPTGAVVAGAAAPATARGYRELLRFAEQHAPGRRAWAIEGTGELRRRSQPLSLCTRRERARGQSHPTRGASAARQRRRVGRGQDRAGRARQRHTRTSTDRRAARGVAAVADRTQKRRRRPPRSTHSTACRHRHRPGAATPTAAPAAGGQAARPLQPLAPHQLKRRRRACDTDRASQPRPPGPNGDRRSPRARTRDPGPR